MKNTISKYGKWALITGGSNGIGLAFAKELAASGHNLILVARGKEALEKRAKELSNDYRITVETIPMDLTAPGAPSDLYEQTKEKKVGQIILSAGMEMVAQCRLIFANCRSHGTSQQKLREWALAHWAVRQVLFPASSTKYTPLKIVSCRACGLHVCLVPSFATHCIKIKG